MISLQRTSEILPWEKGLAAIDLVVYELLMYGDFYFCPFPSYYVINKQTPNTF